MSTVATSTDEFSVNSDTSVREHKWYCTNHVYSRHLEYSCNYGNAYVLVRAVCR